MARKLRIQYPGALYHLINRGNYRSDVFANSGTAQSFLKAVAETCSRFGWRLHAYVVMRNHFHLAAETPEPNLVDGMHLLQSSFATRFNRYRAANGHLFQGRYKSILIEDAAALLRVVNYIHLNPVRAHLTPTNDAAAFPWSSLNGFLRGTTPPWLSVSDWLAQLDLDNTPQGRRAYVEYLARLAEDSKAQDRQEFSSLSQGWAIGTSGWKRALAKKYGRLALQGGMEREEIREMTEARWSEVLEAELSAAGKSSADVTEEKGLTPWKIEIAQRLRQDAGASSQWISDHLHTGPASSLRGVLCRLAAKNGLTP